MSSLCRCFWHSCLLCSVLATPAVPALRVCPPLIISFSCLSCALSNTWCVFLLPSRAYAIRVCPTLGCSLSWFPHLGQINATRCEAVSSLPLSANFCLVLTFPYPFHSPHACATRACSTPGQPLSSYKPCTPHVLLCSPHGACQSCLSDAWCVFLLPSRAYAIRVCPTLGCSLSHLGRINATRLCAACARASSTHVCSARYLQPPPYVPCVSARHLLCPSLAFPTSFCHLCLRKVSCALPQHVMSSSLPLASMCAVYNIPSRTHTGPAPQCRT